MRKQDAVLLAVMFSSMTLGVFVPFIAEPFSWFPRVGMVLMLFVSFLSVDGRDAWRNITHYPFAVFLLILVKLVIMPVACWCIFRLVMPEYALGAALLGGASTAVMAPLFAFMVQADYVLVLVGLVTTSLLLPLVLPAVLAFLGSLAGETGVNQVELPVMAMMANLLVMTVLPFVAAQVLRRIGPGFAGRILERRQTLFLSLSSPTIMIVFAQYSGLILSSPRYVFMAFLCGTLASLVLFAVSSAITFWLPPATQLAFVISCVALNNVVVLIIAVDFFSAPEALTAAMYAAPLFAGIVYYRALARLRGHDPQ